MKFWLTNTVSRVLRFVRRYFILLATCSYLCAVVVMFKLNLPVPFVFVFLLSGVASLLLAIMVRGRARKLIAFNSSVLFFGLAAAEAVVAWQATAGQHEVVQSNAGFFAYDSDLGYRLSKNASVTETLYVEGQIAYESCYSTNHHGWRAVPAGEDSSENEFVFLGCSYTFGTGVNDDETFANQVCKRFPTGARAQLVAVAGFGPHHMLAIIENGEIKPLVKGDHPRFIYVCIPDHIRRCAGLAPWDRVGPQYVIRDDTVERDGNFNSGRVRGILSKFELLRCTREHLMGDGEVKLLAGVVNRMREAVKANYPDSTFHVVLWNNTAPAPPEVVQLRRHFKQYDLNVIDTTDYFPADEDHYFADWHPTPLAHQVVAKRLCQHFSRRDVVVP